MKPFMDISRLYPLGFICIMILACDGGQPSAPLTAGSTASFALNRGVAAQRVVMCHMTEDGAKLLEVSGAARDAHLGHGDHVAQFMVGGSGGDVGDGIHFARIGDAIAAARNIRVARGEQTASACRITIVVAPGIYRGSVGESSDPSVERLPLVIDVPDLTLRGALVMQLDAGGRATGTGESGEVSSILATTPLHSASQFSEPIIVVNGHPGGFRGDGTVIEGFAFLSGHVGVDQAFGGQAIFSLRVSGLVISGNRFEGGFSESVDLRATSGRVDGNHLSGGGVTCDICMAGPGDYSARGNRLLAGGIPGFLIVPAVLTPVHQTVEQQVLPASSTVTASLTNNEVRNHLRIPVGVGIRVGLFGVGAPNVTGIARVVARDNLLVGNNFAVIVDALFPVANTLRKGDIVLTLGGNTFVSSCQNHMLVSLSRHTTGLGIPPANAPYLLGSSYTLNLGGDIAWSDVWYSHPAGFGNTLTVDGVEIPNGSRVAYDATRTCAPVS
jgi:hypothetical protein